MSIVDGYPICDWSELSGVSYLSDQNTFVSTPPTPRIRDLSEVPSPFLNGVLDKIVADNPDEKWIGLWETNRGCPFQCTFCDWGSATAAKVTKFEQERLDAELQWMADRKIQYVFVCDANFGIQKRDVEIAESVAKIKQETGYPHGFSVQNTKNATERAYLTQKIIADAGLNKGVALSMQSLDPHTLKNIKRDNISLDSYWELARRFASDNIETYTDLILPLPGETYESFCAGVEALIDAGQYNRIQFNNLSVLPNAEMGQPEYLEKFGMKLQKSEIINIHGSKIENEDDVPEFQQLVVETSSMSSKDWRRARVFAWMVSFLHFNKLFQIPIVVAMKESGLKFTDIINAFINAPASKFPIVASATAFLFKEAENISDGGPEYVFSDDWLGIYWPADEYLFIQLTVNNTVDDFYSEALGIMLELLDSFHGPEDREIFAEAVSLNRAMLCQPFIEDDIVVNSKYNILEFWEKTRIGEATEIKRNNSELLINRSARGYDTLDDWCRELYGGEIKKGLICIMTQRLRVNLTAIIRQFEWNIGR